jgi:hypothetical protein
MVIALSFALVTVITGQIALAVAFMRLMGQNHELSKLLASRNLTEYSLSEARVAKAISEQKSEDGYDSAWEREENNGQG